MKKSREAVQRIVDDLLKDHPEGRTVRVESISTEGLISTIKIAVVQEQVLWVMGPNEQVVDFESGLRENLRKSLLALGIISKSEDPEVGTEQFEI